MRIRMLPSSPVSNRTALDPTSTKQANPQAEVSRLSKVLLS